MAVRTDITVDFQVSPRLIEVAAPSVDVSIQDLYDTLREIEDDIQNLDDDFLISAGGKEELGGSVLVGITAQLNNAQLLFEARRTPISSGVVTTGGSPAFGSPITAGSPSGPGGTGIVMNDSSGTFVTDGVQRGDLIYNLNDRSSSEILIVDTETQLVTRGLDGGINNRFESDDNYIIYDVIQCEISGGNLVAVDLPGTGSPDTLNPIDSVFPTFGTQIVRTGSSSATIVETGISGLTPAESAQLAAILTVPGDVWEESSLIHNTVDTFGELLNLLAASQLGSPQLGSPQPPQLTVENIVAGVWNELVLGSPQPFPIGSAGAVLKLISETSGLTETQVRAAVWEAPSRDYPSGSPLVMGSVVREIHGHMRREIFIDPNAPVNGDGFQQTPYDNITDAIDDAEAAGITRLVFLGDATLDRQIKNFCVTGVGQPTLDLNGQNVAGTEFTLINLDGSYTGSIVAKLCTLRNNLTGLDGKFFGCGLGGLLTLAPGAFVRIIDGYSEIPGLTTPEISLNPLGSPVTHQIDIRNYSGGLTISNSIGTGCITTIEMSQGRLFLPASNTAGTISIRGNAFLDDLSAGTTIEKSGLIEPPNIVSILTLVTTLIKFQGNRTVLDKTAFTLTIYDNDGVTPIRVFDLRQLGVGPSITEITERLPASGSPQTP